AVRKIFPSQTIGDDQPSPGIAVFQATLVAASHETGRARSSDHPWPDGPRNRDQLPSDCAHAGTASASRAASVLMMISFPPGGDASLAGAGAAAGRLRPPGFF